jgi:hypothetical protein
MERRVAAHSVPYVDRINEITDRLATPWQRHAGWGGRPQLAVSDPDFAASYPAA